MRRGLKLALTAAALGVATIASPAFAATDTLVASACHDGYVQIGGQSSIACVGFYDNNLLQGGIGSSTPQNIRDDLKVLLTNSAPGVNDSEAGYNPPYSLNVNTVLDNKEGLNGANTFTFTNGTIMSGLTVVGLHFGNSPDSAQNNVTAFYLFNLLTPSNTITLVYNGQLNGAGSSNAQLYATGGRAVPEPATWAMMLLGFGGVGMVMRRSRRGKNVLMQVA